MFQLIIVDDEALAIRALRSCIDWSDMCVARVFTANSAYQAKEIFKNNKIDIMLCDIEMPDENGLELLTWVKQNSPETEAIIQSCHSDFKYAKQAIQLESVDYILKPVLADDLINAVKKAINKLELNKKSTIQNKAAGSGHVMTALPELLKNPDNIDSLFLKRIIENQVDIHEDNQVLPVLIVNRNPDGKTNVPLVETIKSLLAKLDLIHSNWAKMINLDDNVYLILLLNWQLRDDIAKIAQIFESVLQNIYKDYDLELLCSIGSKVSFGEIAPIIKNLLCLSKNNIYNMSGKVSLLNKNLSGQSNYVTPDISYWAMLLDANLKNKLVDEVRAFFQDVPDTLKNSTSYLTEIREDFLHMMFAILKQKGIQTQQLFIGSLSSGLFDRAVYSANDMVAWIEHVVAASSNIIQDMSKEHSIIERSIRYIKLHIDQDIKREDVSAYVYLNPDYLTRIFKQETGMSITEYTINERIKIAKKLLENTDMPISSIALRVGYTNFSHFAKTFRKYTGMNPIEFKNSLYKK